MMSQLNSPLYVLCELQVFSLVIQGVGGGGGGGGGVIRLSSRLSPSPFSSPLTDAPSITNKPDTPNIRLNYEASQNIIVTYDQGNPPAEVQWSKDGVSIDNRDPKNGKTTLKLTNEGPDLGVTGKYKVRVSNSVGYDIFEYNVEPECKLMYIYLVIHVWI